MESLYCACGEARCFMKYIGKGEPLTRNVYNYSKMTIQNENNGQTQFFKKILFQDCLIPEQNNFLCSKHLGQILKIGGGKKYNKNPCMQNV